MDLGAEVIAISSDSVLAHKVFHDISPSASKVQYPLLSDQTGTVAKSYGAWSEQEGSQRATFIIDPQGRIRCQTMYPMEVGRNIPEMIRIMQGLQHSDNTTEGIPAGWVPGEPGIKEELYMAGRV